jgi:pimeloyl-ACP methyl ester carboxylesterase
MNSPDLPTPTYITADDGLSLATYSFGKEQGVPVVLQHGFAAETKANWLIPGVVSALLAQGRWVVGIDARGHGNSEKPHDLKRYGHKRMSKDVRCVIDHLAQTSGVAEVDYAGYSMGAMIGVYLIASDNRIRRAVIAGAGANAAGPSSTSGKTSGKKAVNPVNRAAIAEAMERYADDPTLDIRQTFTDPDAIAFLRYARFTGGDLRALAAQMRSKLEAPQSLSNIAASVLVLAGADDHLALTAEELAVLLRGKCVRVPGDHLTAVAEPEFIHQLVSFLVAK